MSLNSVVTWRIYIFVTVFLFVTQLLTPNNHPGSLHVNQIHIVMDILNLLGCLPSQVILLHDCYNMKRTLFNTSALY